MNGRTVSPNSKSGIGNPKSFTLIELLVVVAIISVLVAILLPALNQVRQASIRLTCANQMRQQGMAFVAYAQQENHDRFPRLPWRLNTNWWYYPWDANVVIPIVYPEYVNDLRIFYCPANQRIIPAHYPHLWTYLINSDGRITFAVEDEAGNYSGYGAHQLLWDAAYPTWGDGGFSNHSDGAHSMYHDLHVVWYFRGQAGFPGGPAE